MLFNPKKYSSDYPCEKSKEMMKKTIDFFERKGKQRIKTDDQWCVWYDDFIQFLKDNKIFATLLTPSKYGDADCRWDTWRNCEMNEILAFYSLSYWYAWQVSHSRPGSRLAEQERGGEKEDRPAPAVRKDLRLRPFRAGARRRHLLHGHDAQAANRRPIPCRGRQVLHRKRQPGRHRLHLREDRRHGRVRLLRRRLPQ